MGCACFASPLEEYASGASPVCSLSSDSEETVGDQGQTTPSTEARMTWPRWSIRLREISYALLVLSVLGACLLVALTQQSLGRWWRE